MPYRLRNITEADRTAVVDIFNYFVEHTFAAYPETRVGYEIFDRFLALARRFLAVTVINERDAVVGFAILHPFHPADSFRRTAEIGYFILPEHTGQGLGTRILDHFIHEAKSIGVEILLASISSLNDRSIRFHLKHGFIECGRFKGVGIKKGKTFDVVWMQKNLYPDG